MEKMTKRYEIVVSNAWEISQALLDMEGGKYILAMFSELVQGLLGEGNISGAVSVMRKLHTATDIPFEPCTPGEGDAAVWLELFSAALGDALEESFF